MESPSRNLLKYQPAQKQINLAFFIQPETGPKYRFGKMGSTALLYPYKNVFAVPLTDDNAEQMVKRFLSEAIRKSLKITSLSDLKAEFLGKIDFVDERK